jgi:hypothetical protein
MPAVLLCRNIGDASGGARGVVFRPELETADAAEVLMPGLETFTGFTA